MAPRTPRNADQAWLELLAQAFRPHPLDPEPSRALRERVLARAAPSSVALLQTVRGAEQQWRQPWPRIWMKVLKRDTARNLQLALLRLEPGATMPAHGHAEDEECIVIEGELAVGALHLRSGDLHVAPAGSQHPPITSATGALVFVRSEILTPA